MTFKQSTFLNEAGNRNVVWINPANVAFHTGSKWPVGKHRLKTLGRVLPLPIVNMLRPAFKKREPFLIPSEHFAREVPVETTPRFERVANFIEHLETPKTSAWYHDLIEELAVSGVARHKAIEMRNEAEVLAFLTDYVVKLITDLRDNPYSDPKGGFESSAVINRTGQICKSGSGNHRFNICKALGVQRFPLRIVGMHEDWFTQHRSLSQLCTESALDLLGPIEARHQ